MRVISFYRCVDMCNWRG